MGYKTVSWLVVVFLAVGMGLLCYSAHVSLVTARDKVKVMDKAVDRSAELLQLYIERRFSSDKTK